MKAKAKRSFYLQAEETRPELSLLSHAARKQPLPSLEPPAHQPSTCAPFPPCAAGGGNGTGVTAKLCNNLVLSVSMAAVSEGLALGKHLGLVSAHVL